MGSPMGVPSVCIFSNTAVDEQEESTAIQVAIASSRLLATRSWNDSGWMTTKGASTEPWPSRLSERTLSLLAVQTHCLDFPGLAVAQETTPRTPRLLQEAGSLRGWECQRAGRETQVATE